MRVESWVFVHNFHVSLIFLVSYREYIYSLCAIDLYLVHDIIIRLVYISRGDKQEGRNSNEAV